MRNLDECKAEVFRRSEERIKKRKKAKKYVLVFGMTFAFCITTVLVLVRSGVLNQGYETGANDNQLVKVEEIPNPDTAQDSNETKNPGAIQDSNDMPNQDAQDEQESTECVYEQAEIVKSYGEPQMESHIVTDETQVAELSELIQSIFDNEEGVLREEMQDDFDTIMYQNGNQNSNQDDSYDLSSGSPLKNTDYVIFFKIQKGKYQVYVLKCGVLLDLTKEKALVLTEEELSDLKAAMGVDE